ncbi:MAG: Phospholipase D/Transphosphatidylase [Labilithrix sp.]|nr:Phospholipase D/Transphosphatidylase [Labilithrix sp.]
MHRILSGKTTWRIHERVRSGLLIDAQDYYRAFYEAASRAKRSILILGWQFDSDVQLLRGTDVPPGADPRSFELLPLLDRLCRERPELRVKMLAWDHSVFFALEREILQKIVFDIATVDRFQFKTDGTVPLGGSHHQKVAIIDGQVAFMGSADICQDRWDTSAHVARDPLRVSRHDQAYKPYHEVQAVFTGEPVRSLVDLFATRWEYATGEALDTSRLVAGDDDIFSALPVTLPMPVADVALSRTVPGAPDREHVHEIRDLYVRAIHNAERLIYIETQYLTSCCVRDELVSRMRDADKPKLDVVLVLPHKPEKFKEELTIGAPQAGVLDEVVAAAKEGGHALGIYNVATPDDAIPDAAPLFVYIHAKLMIVDDRLFTMGSANLANRSMTVDSEINATWVAQPSDAALHAAIRRIRVRLLLEHLGEGADVRAVVCPEGLVARLDAMIEAGKGRLRHHDLRHEVPNLIAKAVQELACDYVDPTDGSEPLPPPSSSSLDPRAA